MRKFTAVASALLCMTSVANAGGQTTLGATVTYTGDDKCVPGTIAQTNVGLIADELAGVKDMFASGHAAPSVKTGTAIMPLNNCAVGTKVSIHAGGNFTVVSNVQALTSAGAPSDKRFNNVPLWGFDGDATGKLAMSVHMDRERSNGYMQEVLGPSFDNSYTVVKTEDEIALAYSIHAIDAHVAKTLSGGTYNSTATLLVAIK
jgi:hypothetical protein